MRETNRSRALRAGHLTPLVHAVARRDAGCRRPASVHHQRAFMASKEPGPRQTIRPPPEALSKLDQWIHNPTGDARASPASPRICRNLRHFAGVCTVRRFREPPRGQGPIGMNACKQENLRMAAAANRCMPLATSLSCVFRNKRRPNPIRPSRGVLQILRRFAPPMPPAKIRRPIAPSCEPPHAAPDDARHSQDQNTRSIARGQNPWWARPTRQDSSLTTQNARRITRKIP